MIMIIEPYPAAIYAIERRLTEMGKESRIKDILKKAINETAGKGKKEIWKGVKNGYTLSTFTAGDIKRKNYATRNQSAVLTVKGPTLGILKNYETELNNDEEAAKLKVLKKGTLKTLEIHNSASIYKAFIAKMGSDHEGIFQRVPGKKMKSDPKKEAIKEIMSLSKSKAAEIVYQRNGLYTEFQAELTFRLLKHMNAAIGG